MLYFGNETSKNVIIHNMHFKFFFFNCFEFWTKPTHYDFFSKYIKESIAKTYRGDGFPGKNDF